MRKINESIKKSLKFFNESHNQTNITSQSGTRVM